MLSLVTGSSGLLGRCLVERLRERGHAVRLIDLVPPDEPSSREAPEFIRGDISDEDRVDEAARDVEVIYHLAAAQRMKPQFSNWSEQEIMRKNLNGARNVLRAAERANARKVIFISSSGVYGIPRALPCREDHPTRPLGAYGRSKLLAEEACREATERGLDVTVFRPMSLFGPHMSGVFVMLFEWVRRGLPVYMLGRGLNRVQTVSAWDVADACILASQRPGTRGGVFNLGSEPDTVPTILNTVAALVEHAGSGSPILRIPGLVVRAAARALGLVGQSPIVPEHYILADLTFILDIAAVKEKLAWVPRFDNTQMMIDAYDWYIKAGEDHWQPLHPMLRLLNRLLPTRASGRQPV